MTAAPQRQKKDERCPAEQENPRSPNLRCKLTTAHTVHVDPRTGVRWGTGLFPRGWHRRWKKNYTNRKLSRQSLIAGKAKR